MDPPFRFWCLHNFFFEYFKFLKLWRRDSWVHLLNPRDPFWTYKCVNSSIRVYSVKIWNFAQLALSKLVTHPQIHFKSRAPSNWPQITDSSWFSLVKIRSDCLSLLYADFKRFQNPEEADKIIKIQKNLDDVKVWLSDSIPPPLSLCNPQWSSSE